MQDLERRAACEPIDATAIGEAWTALGNFDRLFVWLNQACDQHVPLVRTVKTEPGFARFEGIPVSPC